MQETGGRRIKRALYIDMNSVRFCDEAMLDRFTRFDHLGDYIRERREEVDAWNREHDIDKAHLLNGRQLTNLGCFRAYVLGYLRDHPALRQDLTLLVRQLAPTDRGLPLELYVFTADTRWAVYESIQADIFDHLLAAIREFELRVFQAPGGEDLERIGAGR
jgi:miniconductance mechanosensitive channel